MPAPQLVCPDQIAEWIPASTLIACRPGQWPGIDLTAQAHSPWAGPVPALRDHLITAFLRPGRVRRRIGGPWQDDVIEHGDISFMPRATATDWDWAESLHNVHLHIGEHYLARIAGQMFGRDDVAIDLVDRLKVRDPLISSALLALADEARDGGQAEQLYVDAIATQLCIHLLRRYARRPVTLSAKPASFGADQARRVLDHIEGNLAQPLSIADLAQVARISPYHFARQFRLRIGLAPHVYVTARRLEHARLLIARNELPLKQVAAACGFCDQAHMSRHFRRAFGITPRAARIGPHPITAPDGGNRL